MSGPVIDGEPAIRQASPAIHMEVTVSSADEPTGKWSKDDKDIAAGKDYAMKVEKKDGGKFCLVCTIACYDKPLAGNYKVNIANKAGSVNATFNLTSGDAPEFTDKPHIVQRDEGKVLVIKIRAKSKHEPTASWTKADKPVQFSDRIKNVVKTDPKKPNEYTYLLEIYVSRGAILDAGYGEQCLVASES